MNPSVACIDSLTRSMDHFLATRMAAEEDIDVVHFVQLWSNTSAMFTRPGAIAGQAMTKAWTTVLTHEGRAHVYCGGRPCYDANSTDAVFRDHLEGRKLVSLGDAGQRYGAKAGQ